MANSETKICQNCKASFVIDASDFDFYAKMKVPPPTWCPECRMIRRMVWRNEHKLLRRPDSLTGKEIFSAFHKNASVVVYDINYWLSDNYEPMEYGQGYDFKKPFFVQLKELLAKVPLPSRSVASMVNSDYSMNMSGAKNAYLCFSGINIEDSAYVVGFNHVVNGLDLYQSRHSEFCYDCYMVDESSRIFFSVNCEDSHDLWFSKNMIGCMNCFGCINLRKKNYHIFNKQVSKEEYKKFIDEFKSGSHTAVTAIKKRVYEFWKQYPSRFTLTINVVDSSGEHIEHTKNVKDSYFVHDGENLRYCQLIEDTTDSYDYTVFGSKASRIYETAVAAIEVDNLRFCWNCVISSTNEEYSMHCRSSNNNFGCISLKKKQYCILNRQYTKEEYFVLREKIIQHMNAMPYIDKRGRVYKYGEFFPPEFSPFAYNETIAQDFFPLTKEQAEAKGYLWRESDVKEYETTISAENLPDDIKDVDDSILKEVVKCSGCGKAYRIIQMELQFYRRIILPIPRLCPDCRSGERFKFVNPPRLWHKQCDCSGATSDMRHETRYTNTAQHFHGSDHCPNEFETSYSPEKQSIVYCEKCYQAEVV